MESPALDAYLTERSQQGRFSGVVLARRGSQTLLERGYGAADRASGRPNGPETSFQIASISKQFAAAAILLLHERGALSVRDALRTWVSECPEEWAPMTLHHLLTHTSGLGHWRDFPTLSLFAPIAREDLLRIFQSRPLKFAPGAGWAYSSPGYVLLADVVARASGEPYATFLRQAIFEPLGMADTGAGNRAPRPEQQAQGYAGATPEPSFELDTVGIGAGDVWSTTRDLTRWDAALAVPGRLLSNDSLRLMFTPHATTTDAFAPFSGVGYGYGWILGEVDGRPARFHPGDNAGFNALNLVLPGDDALVILLSNDEGGPNKDDDLWGLGRRLAGELLDGG